MDLLTQAQISLENIATMKAEFEATFGTIKPAKKEKTTSIKNQDVSLTWSEMVRFKISTNSFPYVDNYTHMIKRTVKNIVEKEGKLTGVVKMGGQTLIVSKDANYADDNWDIEKLA